MYYGFFKLVNDCEGNKVQSGKRKDYNRITVGSSRHGAVSNMRLEEMQDKFFTNIVQDTEQNSGEEDKNIDDKEAPSPELGRSKS
ncbi:hypothetical protein M9H77_09036 [Catharanthus roseus]|uniref:Uncharacterized protein n=1 Tax=Catharanthus roseus TaxID=4058 RepID=A0ACC0BZW3_CATRO|nr:hypothetical protein M9H77_09036 [Catharanthus roseus]